MKHVPIRTCVVCRKQGNKNDFLRIVKASDGKIVADESGKLSGRGAYVCKSQTCVDELIKRKSLNKAFKTQLSIQDYEFFLQSIEGIVLSE